MMEMNAHTMASPGQRERSLVEDLSRPESYPAPRPEAVSVVETHISMVFLAGETAWKVKRPVDLGFLDFRTLEQRRHFCQEELRLNRRLAPDVYQAVFPVRRTASGHSLDPGATGPIVDHAVKMRRLPDEQSALALLRTGVLGPLHLATLAARLADFYREAPLRDDLGGPGVLAGNV